MSEGTQLDLNKQTEDAAAYQNDSLRATKIGEKSEFEKDLMPVNPDDFSYALEHDMSSFQEGETITGTIRTIEKGGVIVDIGYKSDGFIPNHELTNDENESLIDTIEIGDKIKVVIEQLESKEGYTILSRKKAEQEENWNKLQELAKKRTPIQIKITGKIPGGLVGVYAGIRGFISASQVLTETEKDLMKFINQPLDVIIQHIDRKRRKVVFGKRMQKSKFSAEEIAQKIEQLEIGQVHPGTVENIKPFGAFVDIGGIEGLVHISELSWTRISNPADVLKVGDKVNVIILGIDKETQRISLGMKQLQADPWVQAKDTFQVGQWIDGSVSRIVPFGAFVKINENIEGLIHISELSTKRIANIEDFIKVGDPVHAKIIKLQPEEQRIGLSIKQAQESESTEKEHESVSITQS